MTQKRRWKVEGHFPARRQDQGSNRGDLKSIVFSSRITRKRPDIVPRTCSPTMDDRTEWNGWDEATTRRDKSRPDGGRRVGGSFFLLSFFLAVISISFLTERPRPGRPTDLWSGWCE